MILIVGLGNPGLRYKKTRHNAGFKVVDEFRKEQGFSRFKLDKKFQAEVSEGIVGQKKILLVKPQTFMNNSGTAVKAVLSFYKIPIQGVIVIHDDTDIELGEIKISQNCGSAGHNGVESIINMLGTQDFTRVRIGIGTSQDRTMEKFVLTKFSKDEEKIIKQSLAKATQSLKLFVEK